MIDKSILPVQDFTVDELEKLGPKRSEIILCLQRMQKNGEGQFIIGRRGSKSRWIWKQEISKPSIPEAPQPIETPKPEVKQEERIVRSHLHDDPFLKIRNEREGIIVKPVEIKDGVPVEWLLDTSFWDPTQREKIAKELLQYRGGK